MEDRMQPIDDSADGAGSRNLLTIFRRRVWVMIPVAVAVIALAALYAAIQPRIYEASAWMLVSGAGTGMHDGEELLTEADVWRSLQSDIAMHIRLIRRAEMADHVKKQLNLDTPAHAMLERLNVAKVPGASANLLAVTYRSQNPEQAQLVSNAWAERYEQDSRERNMRSTVSALEYVQTQIESVEADLRDMEEQMAELEQEYLESGISIAGENGHARLTSLYEQIAQNRVEMEALQAQIERTRQRLEDEPREIEEVQEQPSFRAQAIEEQLSQLNVELQEKLQSYYEDSPEVTALRNQINRLEQQLEDRDQMTRSAVTTEPNPVYMNAQDTLIELYGQLDALRAAQAALQKQLAEQQTLAEIAPTGAIAYNELMRKVHGLQSVHSALLSRLYELQLKQATAVAPVQVVREADLPTSPVSPQYQAILGLGLVGAVLLAAFAAVVVDQIDDTFADPNEIRETLDVRLVGVLPEIEQETEWEVHVGGSNGATRTAFANAVRMLASTVRIEMSRQDLSSIVVTSSGRAEGKTLVAANLAASLAGAGEKVLLIDCDLHRPRVHSIFGLEKDPGLTNILVNDTDPEELIRVTDIPNLSVITAGALPPSPVDLLASPHGQEVIDRLNGMADYVIWDTPPAGFLADATVVGHKTDRTLFVVGKQARRGAVRQTVSNLRDIGINLMGVCANQVRPHGGSYYYYYYYYYRYDDYYEAAE